MSVATTATEAHAEADARPARRYRATVATQWSEVDQAWRAEQAASRATAFQHADWYAPLYAAAAGDPSVEPCIVTLSDAETGRMVLRLPLVRRMTSGFRTIEFADFNLTDFNAPLIEDGSPTTPQHAKEAWDAVVAALPRADLVRFRKMPELVDGRPNPLALLSGVRPCSLNGNILEPGDDWEVHRFSRDRTFRKELERSWRVFTRYPDAQFEVVAQPQDVARVLDAMEGQQGTRMRELGAQYDLDGAMQAGFYRDLIAKGISSGYIVLTALSVEGRIAATLLGVCHDTNCVMIRISNAGGEFKNASPGRLVIEKTLEHLHAQGFRRFDFSIGNYTYKRRFGVRSTPLLDYSQALSLRGLPSVARDHLATALRKHPHLHQRLMRLLGKPVVREET